MPKTTAKAAAKETAAYRLPSKLVRNIATAAARRGVRPCVLAEQLIRAGIAARRRAHDNTVQS